MNKLVEIIKSIYNIKELRDRILFTLGLLLIYRLGAQVVLPGVDSLALSDLSSRSEGGGLLGILNAFTGGAFANASIFALRNYAIHICINCCSAYGSSSSVSSKTSKRR